MVCGASYPTVYNFRKMDEENMQGGGEKKKQSKLIISTIREKGKKHSKLPKNIKAKGEQKI